MTAVLVRGRQVHTYESHDAVDRDMVDGLLCFALHCFFCYFRAPFGVWMRDASQRVQRTYAKGTLTQIVSI